MAVIAGVGVFFIVIAVVLVVMAIGIYNSLVSLKRQGERAWANIDVILKQRFDELPSLIQIIEQYVKYERDVLQRLMDARTRYAQSQSINDKVRASSEMNVAIRGVLAISEAYPELKSNEQFVHLQRRISGLEDQIADRRELYNESVTNFNIRIEQFPDLFFARLLGYQAMVLFQVAEAEKIKPSLTMNLG